MSIKRDIIAFAIRVIVNETNLVRKPDQFETFINHICGYETFDQQMARNIEVELDRVIGTAKRMNVDRKFKKITKDI